MRISSPISSLSSEERWDTTDENICTKSVGFVQAWHLYFLIDVPLRSFHLVSSIHGKNENFQYADRMVDSIGLTLPKNPPLKPG
jgi:hypothetical protein